MAENKQNTTPERRPDCVTEIRMGNTVLVVSGFFKKDTTDTAEMCIRDRFGRDRHPAECDCQKAQRLEREAAEQRRKHLDTEIGRAHV